MKSIRKKFFVMLLSAMLLLGISSNVQAAGCSDYKRTCVRANGTLYYNQKYKNVYVNCSCT